METRWKSLMPSGWRLLSDNRVNAPHSRQYGGCEMICYRLPPCLDTSVCLLVIPLGLLDCPLGFFTLQQACRFLGIWWLQVTAEVTSSSALAMDKRPISSSHKRFLSRATLTTAFSSACILIASIWKVSTQLFCYVATQAWRSKTTLHQYRYAR